MHPEYAPVLKDKIADILKSEIFLGNIKDGESLTQEIISEKLGVSRMPVREAFLQLESDGILERLKNRHVKVNGMTAKRVVQIFDALSVFEISLVGQADKAEVVESAFHAYETAVPLQGKSICIQKMMAFHLSFSESMDNLYLHQIHKKMIMGYPMFLLRQYELDWRTLLRLNTEVYEAYLSKDARRISASILDFYKMLSDFALKECYIE